MSIRGARQVGKIYSLLEFGRKYYENVQLTTGGYRTYYWESERGAEVDFVIQRDGRDTAPKEVLTKNIIYIPVYFIL